MLPLLKEINVVLDEIAALAYPSWLTDAASFLPKLDLSCIATSGKSFLDNAVTNSTSASVNDFLLSISIGCSSDTLVLSGGYDNEKEEFEINIVFELSASENL